MKITELRAKGKEELNDLVLSLKKEQFNLRMQRATGALEGQGRFKEVRRTIARAKTLLNAASGEAVHNSKSEAKAKTETKTEKKVAAPKKEKAPAKKAKKKE